MKTCAMLSLAAGALVVTAGANAQCMNLGTNILYNAGFETPGATDPNSPEWWQGLTVPSLAKLRTVGDGGSPALFAVGTSGQLTPHSGSGVIQIGNQSQPGPYGGFSGFTTDTRPLDATFLQDNPPGAFADQNYSWDNHGDVVVRCWYMIPTGLAITGTTASLGGASIKLNAKVNCQDVATLDGDYDPTSPGSMAGSTNGQWQQYTRRWSVRDIRWTWYRNAFGSGPTDCAGGTGEGCACVPLTDVPSRIKITPSRWSTMVTSPGGVVFIDDLEYLPICRADLDDGSGTGNPDGGVDINDLLYFLAEYEAGTTGADLSGLSGPNGEELLGFPDCGVDINDLLFFLAHYEGGC